MPCRRIHILRLLMLLLMFIHPAYSSAQEAANAESENAESEEREKGVFKSKDKCIEIDTSQERTAVYNLVVNALAEHTHEEVVAKPLSEKAEMLLGLRPYPKDP